ncbi:MAG: hypothetical protein JNM31_15035 [Flavobacteriales bacterium]|nr:hypothetical protein [Flavobacteriales bacterium]
MNTFRLLILPALLLLMACKKEGSPTPAPDPVPSNFTLKLEHHVDGALLDYDTLRYINEAGHAFSITRLEYYISGIRLLTADSSDDDPVIPGPFYINGMASNSFDLGAVPLGEYTGATLLLGLPDTLNVTGGLPNTLENVNMAWPVGMGGGYHFMKFEGHFLNSGLPTGYAMHLGRNENLPQCVLQQPFTVGSSGGTVILHFNLNEVFRTPHTYDLSSGSYSMGSMTLMALLSDNCADAFTIACTP